MTLKALQYYFHDQLDVIYGKDEVYSFFKLLLEHHLKLKPIEIALNPDYSISKNEQLYFDKA